MKVERTQRNWIQTYTGRQFFPLDPDPADVNITDISWALSHMCRFNGHTQFFYSVGQHSLIVSRLCPPEFALWGLLHDASEAYIADICRPVKPHLSNYKEIEEAIMGCVASRFGLTWPMPQEVKAADTLALVTEKRDVMGRPPAKWSSEYDGIKPLDFHILKTNEETVRELFITRYRELTER